MTSQPESKKNNVTVLRPDRRMLVVNTFKVLALCAFLVLTVYYIWTYQEELNADNFRRVLSFLDSKSAEGGEIRDFTFEQGLDTIYAPLDIGMATYSGGNYNFLSAYSTGNFTQQLSFGSAHMVSSDKKVLIYDQGGKSFALLNSYSLLHKQTLDSPIVSASLNREGSYSIITNQTDYRSALTVWDKKDHQIFQWKTAQHYLLLSSVSPDNQRAAVLCVGQNEGRPDYTVRVFDLATGGESFQLPLGEDRVYSMKHYGSYLVLICRSSLQFFSSKGKLVCQVQFTEKPLLAWDHREDELPLVALEGGSGAELYVWQPDGTCLLTRVLESTDLAACRYRGGTLAVLCGKKLLVSSGDQYVIREVREVRDICVSAEGKVILVYSGKAGYFDPDSYKEDPAT